MRKAVILHGTGGSPDGNWFRWLEDELKRCGVNVWLPQLPDADSPSLREWAGYVYKNCPFNIDPDTLIIGHSSGAVLALLVAQENKDPVGAVACVSVFSGHDKSIRAMAMSENRKLFDTSFDWKKCSSSIVDRPLFVHSDDDPYIPLSDAEYVARKVSADLRILTNQGNFNLEKASRYAEFPQLIDMLREKGWVRSYGTLVAT